MTQYLLPLLPFGPRYYPSYWSCKYPQADTLSARGLQLIPLRSLTLHVCHYLLHTMYAVFWEAYFLESKNIISTLLHTSCSNYRWYIPCSKTLVLGWQICLGIRMSRLSIYNCCVVTSQVLHVWVVNFPSPLTHTCPLLSPMWDH